MLNNFNRRIYVIVANSDIIDECFVGYLNNNLTDSM